MNRRAFLRVVGVGAASVAVTSSAGPIVTLASDVVEDPERLLWTPGQRTYFDLWRPMPVQTGFLAVTLADRQRYINWLYSQLAESYRMAAAVPFINYQQWRAEKSLRHAEGFRNQVRLEIDRVQAQVGAVISAMHA